MNKKYLLSFVVMLLCGVFVAFAGSVINLWDISFNFKSLVGLVAVIPACVWICFKGVNYVNSAVYFAGIGFIMYKNIFNEINARFVIVCVLLCAFAIIFSATAKLFKEEKEKGTEN